MVGARGFEPSTSAFWGDIYGATVDEFYVLSSKYQTVSYPLFLLLIALLPRRNFPEHRQDASFSKHLFHFIRQRFRR